MARAGAPRAAVEAAGGRARAPRTPAESLAAGRLGPPAGGTGPDRRLLPRPAQEWTGGPRFGEGPRAPEPMERAFRYETDLVGAQGWALPARLDDLRRRGTGGRRPPRAAGDRARPAGQGGAAGQRAARPGGHAGARRLRHRLPAGPVAGAEVRGDRGARCSAPCRCCGCPRPGSGGTAPAGSSRSPAATRRSTPAGCCSRPRTSPQLRRLVQDPAVQGLLLGTDDGDEFWTGAGHRRRDPARRPPAAADRAPRPAAHRARRGARRRLLIRIGGGRGRRSRSAARRHGPGRGSCRRRRCRGSRRSPTSRGGRPGRAGRRWPAGAARSRRPWPPPDFRVPGYSFTGSLVETVLQSLRHSCRSELTRQGTSLP